MNCVDYEHIEKVLSQVLSELIHIFTDNEKKEIQHFIDVGEYGLALETLTDTLHEKDKEVSLSVLELIHELAEIMSLDILKLRTHEESTE